MRSRRRSPDSLAGAILAFVGALLFAGVLIAISWGLTTAAVFYAWNAIAPPVFGLPALTWTQAFFAAFGLWLIGKLLFPSANSKA